MHASGEDAALPEALEEAYILLSQRLGRAPVFGLTTCFLYNWTMSAVTDTEGSASRPRLESFANLKPQLRLLCVEEEDWFCRLHVILAGEMSGVVGAIDCCITAAGIDERVNAMKELEDALERLVKVHDVAGVGQPAGVVAPKVFPKMLMQRLYRFMPDMQDSLQESNLDAEAMRQAWVYCATGVDQSAVLHILGIARLHGESRHAMQVFRDHREESTSDIPLSHQQYLRNVRSKPSLREKIEEQASEKTEAGRCIIDVHELSRLELAHNSCLSMLLELLGRRQALVRAMFGPDALKNDWEQEQSLLRGARFKLLAERRSITGKTNKPFRNNQF